MQVATHSGLGFYVNEMQRNINGAALGTAGIIPYGHFSPYRPGAIARGLGDVPNDFEASVDLQYIPVRQAWYYGYPVNGSGYPDARLPKRNGLGVAMDVDARGRARWRRYNGLGDATSDAALQQLAKVEKLQTVLQVVSTLSIATVATLAVIRAIRSARGNGRAQHPFLGDDEEEEESVHGA